VESAYAPPHVLRLAAFAIDVLLVAVLFGAALLLDRWVGEPLLVFGAAVLAFVYFVASTAWLMDGKTAGKAMFCLEIWRADDAPPPRSWRGAAWSAARHSIGYLVTDVLGIGAALCLVRDDRRCVHDHAFGSSVVYTGEGAELTPFERYKRYWDESARRQEALAAEYRWLFQPWKMVTRLLAVLAIPLLILAKPARASTSLTEAGTAPRRLPFNAELGLWGGTAAATGALLWLGLPDGDAIRNLNVVTAVGRPVTDESTFEIHMMKPDGTEDRRLTRNDVYDEEPDLFADARIVFTSMRDGNYEIYAMAADGTDPRRLTSEEGSADWCPDWSPDGERIAFTSDRRGGAEIYVMNADGSRQRPLTEDAATGYCPDWSPDGRALAFASNRDGADNVFTFDETDEVAQVTEAGGWYPRWSPDGKRIAFVSDREGNDDIFVVDADGAGERRLTTAEANDFRPFWAPDGSKILFWSERGVDGGGSEVWAMSPDGADQIKLTTIND
jgi:WD40 repeat protein/RDD family protein